MEPKGKPVVVKIWPELKSLIAISITDEITESKLREIASKFGSIYPHSPENHKEWHLFVYPNFNRKEVADYIEEVLTPREKVESESPTEVYLLSAESNRVVWMVGIFTSVKLVEEAKERDWNDFINSPRFKNWESPIYTTKVVKLDDFNVQFIGRR